MSLPPPPPGTNLAASQQPEIIGSIVATWAFAVITVALRFFARRVSRAGFWWDDWLMLPALAFATILCFISAVWLIDNGLGKHIWVSPPNAITVFLQGLFISELCYTGVITTVKYSILALYWRLFKKTPIRIPIYIVTAMVTCWGLAVILVTLFQCVPLRGAWDKSVNAKCGVDNYKFFYGNSIPNIATDLALLVLPIPCVWSLQIPRVQKFILSGIFVLGGFVIAVSITRLVYLVALDGASPDVNWNFAGTQIWTCVEMNIAIVSGCLPSLRPILSLLLTGTPNPSYGRSATRKSAGGSKLGSYSPWAITKNTATASALGGATGTSLDSDDDQLIGQAAGVARTQSQRIGSTANAISIVEPPMALQQLGEQQGINVKNEVDIEWHKVPDA